MNKQQLQKALEALGYVDHLKRISPPFGMIEEKWHSNKDLTQEIIDLHTGTKNSLKSYDRRKTKRT